MASSAPCFGATCRGCLGWRWGGGATAQDDAALDLKLPIKIHDELYDEVIDASGVLDLASGDITNVVYAEHDLELDGFPAEHEDYDFTCGTLSNGKKDVEFRIEVDIVGRRYSITPSELLELKGRAAKLFSAPPGGHPPPEPPPRRRR